MSWWKPRSHEDVIFYPGRQETEEYVYTPGIHGKQFAEALIKGKILGMKCGDKFIVPPTTFCPDFSEGELVEVDTEWTVQYYTEVYRDLYGNQLEEPVVMILVQPLGWEGGLIHYLKPGIKPEIGLRVRPVFKPEEERRGTIDDILYWEPY
ncbi:MAG: nucleic acid-binding protein [Desulfurococcales archaeon]|nr:nucleic acid-binding protein [Desulfurococcales archaeon]MEB3789515.1 nucleic acid-binding protein [Desulfurococcales archaeon]